MREPGEVYVSESDGPNKGYCRSRLLTEDLSTNYCQILGDAEHLVHTNGFVSWTDDGEIRL